MTFSETVTDVDANGSDFELAVTNVSGASITGATGSGSLYTVSVNTGTGDGTIRLDIPSSAIINDSSGNILIGLPYTNGETYTIDKFLTSPVFVDVRIGTFAQPHIEAIYNAGITGGCSTIPLNYCPNGQVTRAQMAVFLMRGIHGASYSPPAATGTVFNDVPANSFAAAFIEAFASAGITGGCGGGNYCPDGLVTRAQMAVFLLKAKHGSSYSSPAATGTMFNDVPSNAFAAAFIEQLATEGVTSGCGSGNYCPDSYVTRAQMAVFLQRTFNLLLP